MTTVEIIAAITRRERGRTRAPTDASMARLAAGLPAITFIAADTDLNTAAIAEGLTIEDPNAHLDSKARKNGV